MNIITQDENGTVVCSGYKAVNEETWKTHLNDLKQEVEHNELCRQRARNGKLMSTELLPAEYIQQKTLVGTEIENMSWTQFEIACRHIVKEIKEQKIKLDSIYGISRGGLIPAVKLSHLLNLPIISNEFVISKNTLIVDDIADSGKTLTKLIPYGTINLKIATLVYHPQSKITPNFWVYKKGKSWISFPWENGGSR